MRFGPTSVVLSCVVVVMGGAGIVSMRTAASHREVMLGALRNGMQRTYDQVLANSVKQGDVHLTAASLRSVLLESDGRLSLLPSFLASEDVFVPSGRAAVPADELLCVVRLRNGVLYGLQANRAFGQIPPERFGSWPHECSVQIP
jgi:hypothetical protein